MRKIAAFLLILVLLIPGLAAAEPQTRENKETGFIAVIDDSGSLLDAGDYDRLFTAMMPITASCNVGLYTCSGTSKEYVGSKAKTWANSVFPGTCTLFVIDMATRQLMVWSSTDVEKTLTQAKSYTITGNIYSYATKGDYAGCAESAFNQMNRVLNGEKLSGTMGLVSNILLAVLAAILLAYLFISARMEQEVKVSLPEITTATAGAGAVIAAKTLTRKVRHSSSSGGGGGGGGFSGGGGGGGGGFGGGGGSHGF